MDKLHWTPHEKSSSLGKLAWHIATMPARAIVFLREGDFDLTTAGQLPMPDQPGSIAAAFAQHTADCRAFMTTLEDAALKETFTMHRGPKVVMNIPKIAVIRTLLFNHVYHHRGQLSVYLRMLDVPLPPIYGPTADENPFA